MAGTAFDEATQRAVSALIEQATGVKIEASADLTFMDGDEWPAVELGVGVLGEMTAAEFGLFKALVETGKQRDRVRKRITGHLMQLAADKLMSEDGEDVTEENGPLGLLRLVVGNAKDIPHEMIYEEAKHDEAYTLMSNMFYFGLKSRFHRHGEKDLGVRRGGKVVAPVKEKKS